MNRGTRTIAKVMAIVVATLVSTVLAYYVSAYLVGHRLATLSGGMNYSSWQDEFLMMTIITGGLCGLCSLIWFVLTRAVFKIESAQGVGRRIIWAILALVTIIICVAVPQAYSIMEGIKINGVVIGLYITFFTVVNYWLLSIFTTPLSFKYTPVGAQLFLSRSGK